MKLSSRGAAFDDCLVQHFFHATRLPPQAIDHHLGELAQDVNAAGVIADQHAGDVAGHQADGFLPFALHLLEVGGGFQQVGLRRIVACDGGP